MAATWIKPLHVNKGKTIAQTITDRTDYAENPDKTRKGELITAHACSPRTVDTEFLLSKREYAAQTGRDQGDRDVLAYHIRQSFKPGEISPEEANKIGYELAMRFTKGNHSFIVATHDDRKHIHNHIVFNSTNLECARKFVNFWGSSRAIRRLSDQICLENGLSIIENPKPSRGHYGTWLVAAENAAARRAAGLGDKKAPTWREKLEQLIDGTLPQNPADFEAFINLLTTAKCEVKQGKHISLKMDGQKKFIRLRSLSEDYSEDAIRERISGKRIVVPKKKAVQVHQPAKVNMLIDIQAKIQQGKGAGYERWAKIFNLKQVAQTLIFLQENDITEMDSLQEKAQAAKDDFNDISVRLKAADSRMKEISLLQKQIGTYSKTREVYAAYRRAGYSKKFLAEHGTEIVAHKAAKKAFDKLGLKKLPTIKTLQTEYATLSAEKKKLYSHYGQARKFMQEILVAKQNAEQLLDYNDTAQDKKNERTER